METEYKDNIIEIIDRQIEKGFKKYGQTLEDNDTLGFLDFIRYAQEEVVDFLFYLEKVKNMTLITSAKTWQSEVKGNPDERKYLEFMLAECINEHPTEKDFDIARRQVDMLIGEG